MLTVWIERDSLLILGLTFMNSIGECRNHISLWRESSGAPMDVVLATASSRELIADAIAKAQQRIIISQNQPIWHCVTRRHQNESLHVCLAQDELLLLRQRPLSSFYRLNGAAIKTSFDTLIIGATNENDMIKFLTRVNLIDENARVEQDLIQIRC